MNNDSLDIKESELIEKGLYYNRPASELIFLSQKEHAKLHMTGKPSWCKGKKLPEEICKKMSISRTGLKVSEEARKKISAKMKGRTAHNKGKNCSEEQKLKISMALKEAHKRNPWGMSKEARDKISKSMKAKANKALMEGK